MEKICTIGYTKKTLERFIGLLREAGVDLVVDIRLNNTSQLAGFAKRDDLAFLLKEGFGIRYEHDPRLAPAEGLLQAYKTGKDWDAYETAFSELMADRDMVSVVRAHADAHRAPCLLCSEDKPDKCHRRLLAEAVAEAIPGLEVVHL